MTTQIPQNGILHNDGVVNAEHGLRMTGRVKNATVLSQSLTHPYRDKYFNPETESRMPKHALLSKITGTRSVL